MSLPTYTTIHHSSPYPAISLTLPSLSTTGKNILISGAGSGLGRALAFSFATSGAKGIALLGRSVSALDATAAEVKAKFPGTEVLVLVADIASEVDIGAAFEKAKQAWGEIDILVQNAAYLPDIIPITSDAFSVSEWKRGLDINVIGNLHLARAFLRSTTTITTATSKKKVIHITTAGAHFPAIFAGMSAYITSKIAALKMMEYFAAENTRVRVMFVHPGILNTEGAKKATEGGFPPMPNDDSESLTLLSFAPNPLSIICVLYFQVSHQSSCGLLSWKSKQRSNILRS
jgi:NAD(P)-dependent dehydrogenase (short-subunit alcohol dehydrogenase family)